MRRTLGTGVLIAILSAGIAALGHEVFYLRWLRPPAGPADPLHRETGASDINRGLRAELPLGTPRPIVEAVLRDREYSFHSTGSSQDIVALAPDPRDSSPQMETTVSLQFHFDQHALLQAMESRVIHAKPGAR